MTIEVEQMLSVLPPYRDQWIRIKDDQNVPDIMNEVLEAHEEFAPYYDDLVLFFNGSNTESLCDQLYYFLKKNIKYKEESEKNQTSALPAGLLTRGYGDCKHYSGFAAGILDAMKRQGKKINWCYRFASYRLLDTTPHHVFVVVNPGTDREIWIDPTPGADKSTPVWQVDKKIKGMAIDRNIGSLHPNYLDFEDQVQNNAVGKASLSVWPTNDDNINHDGTGRYKGVFGPYMGLTAYRDYSGDRNINADELARELNRHIQNGPSPGHTVDANFVRWVYDNSIRSWNFYYPRGVKPGFTAETILPAGYPRLIITADGRLITSPDVPLDDYRNAEIHLLTAWAQSIINDQDPTPYPVRPQHIKEHSQGKEGNFATRNLFTEARGDSFIKEIGQGLVKGLEKVGRFALKVVGSIPRNAFLAMVGLNIFNIAKKMGENIDEGKWEQMAAKWRKLGGNPEKLKNTIADGRKKPAADENAKLSSIGAAETGAATIIAAAAPIIAAMLAFIKDPDGKLRDVVQATRDSAAVLFPDLDLTPFGFLDRNTGREIDFVVDPLDDENLGGGNDDLPGRGYTGTGFDPIGMAKKNPLLAAAAAGGVTYMLQGKKKSLMMPLIVSAATYFLLTKQQPLSANQRLLTNG